MTSQTMQAKEAVRTTRAGVTRCHCGAAMGHDGMTRVDHCPCCGCEEHERVCDHVCAKPRTRNEANHADTCWGQ